MVFVTGCDGEKQGEEYPPIKIAVIDTGFSTRAIPAEHIIEGKNYLYIINISAGLVLDKESVREAIAYAEEKGVLVVASAGNDYELNAAVKYYPAAYDTVLAVGSLNVDGTAISAFSQRSEWVDTYVTGEQVTITTLSGNIRTSDGTSYSVAKITAEAAKYLKEDGDLTPQELRKKIIFSA